MVERQPQHDLNRLKKSTIESAEDNRPNRLGIDRPLLRIGILGRIRVICSYVSVKVPVSTFVSPLLGLVYKVLCKQICCTKYIFVKEYVCGNLSGRHSWLFGNSTVR